MTDPSRPSQLGTSPELGRSKSPPKVSRNLAPVAESESSDVVAISLDRPYSDDVQVNISLSSFREEGHLTGADPRGAHRARPLIFGRQKILKNSFRPTKNSLTIVQP